MNFYDVMEVAHSFGGGGWWVNWTLYYCGVAWRYPQEENSWFENSRRLLWPSILYMHKVTILIVEWLSLLSCLSSSLHDTVKTKTSQHLLMQLPMWTHLDMIMTLLMHSSPMYTMLWPLKWLLIIHVKNHSSGEHIACSLLPYKHVLIGYN